MVKTILNLFWIKKTLPHELIIAESLKLVSCLFETVIFSRRLEQNSKLDCDIRSDKESIDTNELES